MHNKLSWSCYISYIKYNSNVQENACTHSGLGGSIIAHNPMIVNHGPRPLMLMNSGPKFASCSTSDFGMIYCDDKWE